MISYVLDAQVCGGRVLRCLTEHREDLKSDACQKEVLYFEKMEVTDYRNDVILAAACRVDVEKFCTNVQPGEGRMHECLRSNRKRLSEPCRKEELLLEEQEAESVELRLGLMKSCVDERAMFCKGVATGQARVFRCLAEKMGDADFGDSCRGEIVQKLQRRQANWKLDPPLRKACRSAVKDMCAAEDQDNGESGRVYKCLIRKVEDLDGGCAKELSRAVHMAFYAWEPSAILTAECDADIQFLCLAKRPNMAKTPGAIGLCLAALPPAGTLADVAEPPNMRQSFEAGLTVALLQNQLSMIESTTGVPMLNRNRAGQVQSITLTGWTALFGITAMVVLVAAGSVFGYRRYKGINERDYTLVVKGRH
ncbi:MAG: hypothetical protein WDW38_003169 [Sanguina aurantia]